MRLALILVIFLLFTTTASAASPCPDALVRLRADDGRAFVAGRYGIGRWQEKTARGRLPYAVHVWEGRLGTQQLYLHFTEIPGTSGPNWSSERRLSAYRAKILWQRNTNFPLPQEFRVYAGPLTGGWTTVCAKP
jgi:hypothetical protein